MKKILLTVALVALMSGTAFATISGSAHDFSAVAAGAGQANQNAELCIFCHTPHNSAAITDAPLWNHTTTTATFTLYSSATLDATMGQPQGISKLCLSCHDGTVGIDSFGNNTTGTTAMLASAAGFLDTDLSNDHPVSFVYDNALFTADGGLNNPTVATTSLGGTIDADLLFNTRLECASCHDVHNDAGNPNLLVISNVGSNLCITCHAK